MANFTAGTSFSDGVTNDVTAAKLNALVADAVPTSNLSLNSTTGTIATFNSTTGTIATLNSTTGTITTGVIPTLTSTTLITTGTGTAAAPAIVPTGDTNTGIFFPAADTIAFAEGGAEAMRIDSSGRIGIGTASPQKELQINATEPTIRLEESGGGSKRLELSVNASAEAKIFANQSGGTLVLGTVGTERLRIDSSGNVLVGTTDSDLTAGVGLKLLASATAPLMGYVINTANGASSNYHIYNINATNNGYRFYVTANGGISNFSANNVNLSDERLKTNINPSGNYLDKICSIPVKTFNYKDQGEDTEKTIGVLAQEVEAHIPELINNDGFGETPADGIPLKTIYQTDLQYVLMRCVQELKAENDSLKSRIEALEAK
jgi:hypothetical protein